MFSIDTDALTNYRKYTLYAAMSKPPALGPAVSINTGDDLKKYTGATNYIRKLRSLYYGFLVSSSIDVTVDPQPAILSLTELSVWWLKQYAFLDNLQQAVQHFATYNNSVKTYFNSGIVSEVNTSSPDGKSPIANVLFYDDGNIPGVRSYVSQLDIDGQTVEFPDGTRNTQGTSLNEFYSHVKSNQAFSANSHEAAIAVDEAKNNLASIAINDIQHILRNAESNYGNATQTKTGLLLDRTSAESVIQSSNRLKDQLSTLSQRYFAFVNKEQE